jgi:hypothetical protein
MNKKMEKRLEERETNIIAKISVRVNFDGKISIR